MKVHVCPRCQNAFPMTVDYCNECHIPLANAPVRDSAAPPPESAAPVAAAAALAGRRLALAFGLVVLMLVIATGFAISGIRSMGKALELVHARTDKIQVGNELEIQQYSRGLLTAGIPMMEDKAAIEDRNRQIEANAAAERAKEAAAAQQAKDALKALDAARKREAARGSGADAMNGFFSDILGGAQ